MSPRRLVALIAPLLLTASPLFAAPATAAPRTAQAAAPTVLDRHACTHTSSGSCIRGGQFCPKAKYHHSGWDAKGRRYVCKGNHTHPHWMKP